MTSDPAIVVTGVGVRCPLGDSADAFWAASLAGVVATRELRHFETTGLGSRRGGELVALRDARVRAAAAGRRPAPFPVELASMVARDAVRDAGVLDGGVAPERVGVCFGTVMGTRPAIEEHLRADRAPTPAGTAAREPGWLSSSQVSRAPAVRLGLGGPVSTFSTACAAGNTAIAVAAEALRAGQADAMLAGGADELSWAMLAMFDSFRSLAPDAVRPFDRHRRGLLLAEGAAALVLEREADARARGARPYGRLLGHANRADAHHMTAPHPDGRGALRAMRAALERAGLEPRDVDHVSAHGTGTPGNDAIEAFAIRALLGAHADRVPVTAVKSTIGHAQGAASAIEAVACLLTLRDGLVPPTANVEALDPACDVDVVVGAPRAGAFDVALSNAFGFGGNIECVVFGAP